MGKPCSDWSAEDLRAALVQAADGEIAWACELLAMGADPSGMPLLMAIQCGELAIVRLFLAAGADVERDWAGTTPLLHAVTSGYPAIVQALIEAGADVNKSSERGHPLTQVEHGSQQATADDWNAIRRMLLDGGSVRQDEV